MGQEHYNLTTHFSFAVVYTSESQECELRKGKKFHNWKIKLKLHDCLQLDAALLAMNIYCPSLWYTAARNQNLPRSFHTRYTYQHLVENKMHIASY